MELGETIATYDVDLALRGEIGKFEITSPSSDTYYVTCKSNRPAVKADSAPSEMYPQAFLIKKIAEPVALHQNVVASAMTMQRDSSSSILAPFLLEDRGVAEEIHGQSASLPTPMTHSKVWGLELCYSENGEKSARPSAFIFVQRGEAAENGCAPTQMQITSACANFNEFDSEIRRLHAELDDMCLRAKKKFYKAYAAASA
jgi:hypothetical protein